MLRFVYRTMVSLIVTVGRATATTGAAAGLGVIGYPSNPTRAANTPSETRPVAPIADVVTWPRGR